MKTLIGFILISVLLFTTMSYSMTPEATWIQTYTAATKLDQQGNWPEARRTAQLALKKADYSFGRNSLNAAKSHLLLAELYAKRGKSASAEMHFINAIRIRERLFGQNHVSTAKPLTCLAELYVNENKLNQARIFFSRAVAARQGNDDPGTAKALAGLAALEARSGRLDESVALLNETLRLFQNAKKYSDELCPLGIRSLIDLAEVYMIQGKHSRAANSYKLALAGLESFNPSLNSQMHYVLVRLGDSLRLMGSPQMASNYYRRSIAVRGQDGGLVTMVMRIPQ